MYLLPPLLKIDVKNLSDLDILTPPVSGLFKTHLHLNIDESLAETLPLEFNGTAQELKWKVIELVKVPIEEILYAYAAESQKLYLLNKKIWQEKINQLPRQCLEIEKITLNDLNLEGLELSEPLLHYAQIKKGLTVLTFLAVGLVSLLSVMSVFFKAPAYQTLASLNETSQNLKNTLTQVLETEKELTLQKEKMILQKKWLKVFKNFPQQLPGPVKLSEISLDDTSQTMQLKGETKNQTLLQNWAKQMPRFTLTQIQLQSSPNAGYQFAAVIQSEDPN